MPPESGAGTERDGASGARWLRCPACGGPRVVGMIDVTVHPRFREDGTTGPIVDTLRGIKYDVERSAAPDKGEAYCFDCGEQVVVP